ncbi:putative microtubule-associated protein [Phytophthora cinnamomi]|uniref:putative microtubule-associated protein n=1 Tax=Phytophthora cinnamomi TaxID=4785 RepID=UPI003559BBB7|nr:putative microtubule-associated protein [Phytophthora cinnamomi]
MGNALLLAAVKDRQAVALADAILPFDNLRLHEVEAFWRAFYDSATSFALSKSQLRSICCRAVAGGVSSLQGSNARVAQYADAAFDLFADPFMQRRWQQLQPSDRVLQSQQYSSSSDSLAAIDALEFLSAIAFIAAIPLDEKIDLLFDSWDMSEDGALDLDEFTISLKSTLAGLAKIIQPVAPSLATRTTSVDPVVDEEEIILLAESNFREISNCGAIVKVEQQELVTITCEQFREFCVKNKRAKELFDLFDVADASSEDGGLAYGDAGGVMEAAETSELAAKLDKHSEPSDSTTVAGVPVDALQDDVGDMFLAVKPWIGAIVAPSKIPPLSKGAPLVSVHDIIEIDVASGSVLNSGQPLFSGHFALELWGLAVHPSQRQFVTVGDDRTLRVWDMDAKRLIQARALPAKARACAYSPDSELVAVGFGGDNGVRQRKKPAPKQGQTQSREGGFAVFRVRDLDTDKLVFEDKPGKEWISDIKFSPCGNILALGSHDNSIYLYTVGSGASEFKKRKPFSKHSSYITHFDFSEDSNYLQSNCGGYEYLFCDTASSNHVTRASSLRDVKWATWTCTLGWPVQGIWPECADGTDINAVSASSSRTILASGDDSSNVKFFRYPCIPKGSKFIACRGHSSHVANVRFSFDDKYLISVGGNDRSIFQWKLS